VGSIRLAIAKKAQVAIEFMFMVSLAMLVVVVMIGVLYYLFTDYSEDRNIKRLQDLGYSIQSELILASEVEPGYERTITLPNTVGSADYGISQTENDLVINYRKTELLFSIPKVSGSFSKTPPNNTIRKCEDNTVIINSLCP
jgi:hypothetical protein